MESAHVIRFMGRSEQQDVMDRTIEVILARYPEGSPVHSRTQMIQTSWELIGWLNQAETDFIAYAVANLRSRRKGASNA